MISCEFGGELGNNLFQLATCLAQKEKLNVDYELLRKRGCYISNEERPLEIEKLFNHKFSFVNKYSQNYKLYKHNDSLQSNDPNYTFLYKKIPNEDNTLLSGYFQSEKYFLNIKEKLINHYFCFNPSHIEYIKNKYKNILNNSIAVHVRVGGDRYFLRDSYPIVPSSFYQNAINQICEKYEIENINIFSDDMKYTKDIFPNEVNFIENETNIIDLIFMSLCSHNIIGNSTFSWWSSYLNKNKNNMVIVPKTYWIGNCMSHIKTDDLFPDKWIKL